jgi:hypothetical protein
MKTLHLDKQQEGALIVTLNMELRAVTGVAAHPLNEIFRQLVGRDHDVFTSVTGLNGQNQTSLGIKGMSVPALAQSGGEKTPTKESDS